MDFDTGAHTGMGAAISNEADVLSISDFQTCGLVLTEILHWLTGHLGAFEV